jgi:hypothetical protein
METEPGGQESGARPEDSKPPEPQPIDLIIRHNPDGSTNVIGPLANKMLCYGMIEIARETVANYKPESGRILRLEPAPKNNGQGSPFRR